MSQQMEFDETSGERQRPAFHGYESGYRDAFVEASGEKVSPYRAEKGPSSKGLTQNKSDILLHGSTAITMKHAGVICGQALSSG